MGILKIKTSSCLSLPRISMESATKQESDAQSVQSLCLNCLEKERNDRTGSTSQMDNTKTTAEQNPRKNVDTERTSDSNSNSNSKRSNSADNSSDSESLSSSWNDLFTIGTLFYEDDVSGSQRDVSLASPSQQDISVADENANSTSPGPTDASDRFSLDMEDEELAHRLQRLHTVSVPSDDIDDEMMGELPIRQHLFDDFGGDEEDISAAAGQIIPLYPMGKLEYTECAVCCEQVDLYLRACCDCPVCDSCMLSYITIQVEEARVRISCPNDACDKYVHRDEIIVRLSGPVKDKFFRFLVDANKEINVKTCPKCSSVMTVDKEKVIKPDKMGVMVVCEDCELEWCFVCQAPFHDKLTCKQYRRGDKLLHQWARENHFGQTNAQKCPKCKAFISRTSGCDHMTCSQCRTEFCYRCGGRFLSLRFLGDHYNRLSIFGCKYRLMPERPHMRKFIRGSLFAGKMALVPVVASVAVGVCAVFAAAGVVILPVFGGIRLHKWRKKKKAQKAAAEARREWRAKLAELRGRGDPYLERYRLMQLGNMDLSLYGYDHTMSGDSTDSLPETSSSAEPRETEHIASVHKSGSPISSKESTTSEWDSMEVLPEIDSSKLDEPEQKLSQGAEPEQKLSHRAESEQKLSEGAESSVKVSQEAESGHQTEPDLKVGQEAESDVKLSQEAESEEVPLAEEEDMVDFKDTDNKSETENCDVDTLKEDSVENTQEEVRKEVTIEITGTVSNSKEEQESKITKEKEEIKKVKDDKKSKPSSSSLSSSPSPPMIYAPLDNNKDDMILVQKPAKKTSEDGYKVKSIVSQYSCLGGKSREEEDYDDDNHVGIPSSGVEENNHGKKTSTTTTTTAAVVGKLMIRSASYDVAIREAEGNNVSVRQMVKRYSQGTTS